MKNFKLILKSLVSNNACIEGATKKKWWVAVIMFFISTILALVPTFVKQIKTQGDDVFENTSYRTQEALYDFSENVLAKDDVSMKVVYVEQTEEKTLIVNGFLGIYNCVSKDTENVYFKIAAYETITDDQINEITAGDYKGSYAIFSSKVFYMVLKNPVNQSDISSIVCSKAYEYIEDGFDFKTILITEGTLTDKMNGTFDNWKVFVRDAYNYNRLTNLWVQCAIVGGVEILITVLMGFMIWVLTRGKNNPYRWVSFWQGQKISYWTSITPAILTCGLGFLLTSFGPVLFPLLQGVRTMWLSMKSFRPDGTGYANY